MNWTRLCLGVVLLATLTISATAQERTIKYTSAKFVNPSDSAQLYRQHCASCHGLEMDGRGPASSSLNSLPPDLRTIAVRNKGKFDRIHVQEAIKGREHYGRGAARGEMPDWHRVLSSTYQQNENLTMLAVRNLTDLIATHQK
jgi:mono/diheme cytochrome c family protein